MIKPLFSASGKISWPLVAIFVLINGLVLANAILHEPTVGYDVAEHLRYIEALAAFHLPTPADSKEFFSPPLPYVLPGLALATGQVGLWAAAKLAQLGNVLLSLGVTLLTLCLCGWLRPDQVRLKLLTLAALGVLPVYYKTFAMVRGEPFVAFCGVWAVCEALVIFVDGDLRARRVILLGLALGLGALSRQWGFLLFPALGLFALMMAFRTPRGRRLRPVLAFAASMVVAFLTSGWFYLHLLGQHGTATAFNRQPADGFSLRNQPAAFYFGLALDDVFSSPVRSAFANQFWPMFYSETWGDYWGYFVVWGRDTRDNHFLQGADLENRLRKDPTPVWLVSNVTEAAPLLGRVNAVSLPASLLFLAALAFGVRELARFALRPGGDKRLAGRALCALIVLVSLAGYFWFLLMYPIPVKGDTIKATYMLHTIPFVAILLGEMILPRGRAALRGALALLGVTTLHNLPVMITHYIPWEILGRYLPCLP